VTSPAAASPASTSAKPASTRSRPNPKARDRERLRSYLRQRIVILGIFFFLFFGVAVKRFEAPADQPVGSLHGRLIDEGVGPMA
jgi:hypothetical protein